VKAVGFVVVGTMVWVGLDGGREDRERRYRSYMAYHPYREQPLMVISSLCHLEAFQSSRLEMVKAQTCRNESKKTGCSLEIFGNFYVNT
jgi:hypothetical protein